MANNNGRKKTKAEVREYKNAVKLSAGTLKSTIDTRNTNLVGSDELSVPDFSDDTSTEARLPWRTRVKRFIRKHTFEVGLAILAALIGWYGVTLFELKVDCAVLETKLDRVSAQIESLDTDNVTREVLNIQLDALKQELSYEQEINRIEIENRIGLLEQQIALVQESIQKGLQNN